MKSSPCLYRPRYRQGLCYFSPRVITFPLFVSLFRFSPGLILSPIFPIYTHSLKMDYLLFIHPLPISSHCLILQLLWISSLSLVLSPYFAHSNAYSRILHEVFYLIPDCSRLKYFILVVFVNIFANGW